MKRKNDSKESVHFIMMIDKSSWMRKALDCLVRTIKKNCPIDKKVYFSCVFQGNKITIEDANIENKVNLKPINVEKIEKIIDESFSKSVRKNVEFYYCPYYWELGIPCRWFVEAKSETCIMIDVDMICCNSINDIFKLDKNKIHACYCLDNSILYDKNKCYMSLEKYYVNFGFLVIPSNFLIFIGSKLLKYYSIFQKKFGYLTGQVVFSYIIKKYFEEKINILPNYKYNCYDVIDDERFFCYCKKNNIDPIFLHLLYSKNLYKLYFFCKKNLNEVLEYALIKSELKIKLN